MRTPRRGLVQERRCVRPLILREMLQNLVGRRSARLVTSTPLRIFPRYVIQGNGLGWNSKKQRPTEAQSETLEDLEGGEALHVQRKPAHMILEAELLHLFVREAHQQLDAPDQASRLNK